MPFQKRKQCYAFFRKSLAPTLFAVDYTQSMIDLGAKRTQVTG